MIKANLPKEDAIIREPLLERFPFPFKGDSYRYSNNSEPLEPQVILDITPEYYEEIKLKREILYKQDVKAYQSLAHSLPAQWEILEMIMDEMVGLYPQYFQLYKSGASWTFHNILLDEEQQFTFGDTESLPYEPLDFIGRHIQEDLFYLAERDGDIYLDAGQLCFPGNWSMAFDLGMTYTEFHSPVPHFSDSGLALKVRDFLKRMEAGKPWTRLNWTFTVGKILETAPETFDKWGPKKETVTADNAGEIVYLRVEDQRLFRLSGSNGILFSIHTHMISLRELCKHTQWMNQLYHVLQDIPEYMAAYKGFLSYKGHVVQYLEAMRKGE